MEAKIKQSGKILSVPLSTYRVQFWRDFPIKQALSNDLPKYLKDLGVAYCYSSPLLKARPGSTHGYDVVDHLLINPEIATSAEFDKFSSELKSRDIGLLVDIVPNHVGIGAPSSRWWMDVLEHGRGSVFSDHFDINWKAQGNKILVATLGSPLGKVIEDKQLKATWNEKEEITGADGRGIGALQLHYYSNHYPLDPASILPLLPPSCPENIRKLFQEIKQRDTLIGEENELGRLARREQSYEAKKALDGWMRSDGAIKEMQSHLDKFNADDKKVAELVAQQAYRLAYWKIASDELNYRRFFDVNELLAIKSENKGVFEESVQLIKEWIQTGKVQALRLDHPDGLYNPAKFFKDLQEIMAPVMPKELVVLDDSRPLFVLVEKILEPGESLRTSWPVSGTVGYEYMNVLNDVFVDTVKENEMRRIYAKYVSEDYNASTSAKDFAKLLYTSKRNLLFTSFQTELDAVSLLFQEILSTSSIGRDFSLKQIKKAIVETVANCPVYRTYITQECDGPTSEDNHVIDTTFKQLREKNEVDSLLADLIENVYRCKGEDKSQDYKKKARHAVMKLQQLTGPVMAKGLEDTSFYRFFLLTSLNEVGGDPDKFGLTKEEFHKYNQTRVKDWPHTMSNSSTHDTKRSEDVRARINTLSEIPDAWEHIVYKWREMNAKFKTNVAGLGPVPGPNEEYMIYQTLVGAWPMGAKEASEEFIDRMRNYLNKCVKEAKQYTTWVKQNEPYEKAVIHFMETIVKDHNWLASFLPFIHPLVRAAKLNSVSLVSLKLTCPGIPDIYQGQEVWDFSLVDPDNRRPVDYVVRQRLLSTVKSSVSSSSDFSSFASKALEDSDDSGTIKLMVTERLLDLRNRNQALFLAGDYQPITAPGSVVAFRRSLNNKNIVVASRRFFVDKNNEEKDKQGTIELTGSYRDVLTGKTHSFSGSASLSTLFSVLPFVVLESN
eukprot:TRINITY_DN2006_c0_g1_i3.p1 TRINITY_DN2006_c0_g1~~TRINITY_DN2006_c0_g1_i3.p1  ORF type:complete len:948 (-),score=292.63 TRINITY_DN2006_c0_g1_i3:49-2892(-)